MIHWYYLLAAACLLLLFLFYREWTRKQRSRLYGRLVASLLAVVCLVLLAYPNEENSEGSFPEKIVLLTDGFIKDSVSLFILQNKSAVHIFAGEQTPDIMTRKVQRVADWKTFTHKHATDTLHVFGNGFNPETLAMFNPHPLVYHASPARPAISAVYWKQAIETGEKLHVQGMYHNTGGQPVKIVLQAFGVNKDSATIAADTQQLFELQTIPVYAGRAVYSLITIAGNDTLCREPVPAETKATVPLQLLVMSSSPDFDNTYLKNHLSQNGYQVTVITDISTNKKDKQFLNMPARNKGIPLTGDYLNSFDVLMTDQETLQKISPPEFAAVRSAVQDKGMGLVIKMDGHYNALSFYTKFFPVKTLPPGKEQYLQLRSGSADSNRYKIKITDPAGIGAVDGSQVLLQDAQSNIYASAFLYGSGKIIGTTLQNTYSMALAGNLAAYRQLWWLLLNKAAKKIYPEETTRMHPAISFANHPVQMELENNGLMLPRATAGNTVIFLQQDALLPYAWHGMYWPVEAGWQEMPATVSSAGGWYVYKPGDWQQLMDHTNRAATEKYTAAHPVSISADKPADNRTTGNWRLYLLIVFFASCIFLWVEQKIA